MADRDTRRSATNLLVLSSDQPLLAYSARQYTVTRPSTEAEYVAADTGARALTWVSSLAAELRIPVEARSASLRIDDKPATKYHEGHIVVDTRADIHLLTDNKSAFNITHTSGSSMRTKQLDVRHLGIQQQVQARVLRLSQVPTSEKWAEFPTPGCRPRALQGRNAEDRLRSVILPIANTGRLIMSNFMYVLFAVRSTCLTDSVSTRGDLSLPLSKQGYRCAKVLLPLFLLIPNKVLNLKGRLWVNLKMVFGGLNRDISNCQRTR